MGREKLLRERVDLGDVPGRANVGLKGIALMTALPADSPGRSARAGLGVADHGVARAGRVAHNVGL